jgi:hypothetical protein
LPYGQKTEKSCVILAKPTDRPGPRPESQPAFPLSVRSALCRGRLFVNGTFPATAIYKKSRSTWRLARRLVRLQRLGGEAEKSATWNEVRAARLRRVGYLGASL